MKKKFIEPELVRIDLNMTENIASSGAGEKYYPIISSNGFEAMFATKQSAAGYCTTFVADSSVSLVEFHANPTAYNTNLDIITTCPIAILQMQGKM